MKPCLSAFVLDCFACISTKKNDLKNLRKPFLANSQYGPVIYKYDENYHLSTLTGLATPQKEAY